MIIMYINYCNYMHTQIKPAMNVQLGSCCNRQMNDQYKNITSLPLAEAVIVFKNCLLPQASVVC